MFSLSGFCTQANAKEGLLYAIQVLKRNGTNNKLIASYATSILKQGTRNEKWARQFVVQHGAHKELSKLFLFWKEDAIVLGWILSAFNNIACSDQVRNDLLDDDLVKNVCDLLRSGKFSNNEFNLQTAIHALGNFIYQNEEAALCVAKFLGSEPEKIILSSGIRTFIEKGFDTSSNSLGQYINYMLDAVEESSEEMAKNFVEQGALKMLITSMITRHKKNKWDTVASAIGGIRSLVQYCPEEVYVVVSVYVVA